jgi:hypothetical protein
MVGFMISCKKDETDEEITKETEFVDKNWNRIRIPDGGQIQAVAGNIDDTLIVTTLYNTFFITNKGTNISLTTTHLNNTPGLYVSRDTIYALSGSSYDVKFQKHYASMPSYYTLDKGATWHSVNFRRPLYILTGVVTTKNNSTIQLNYHSGADKNGIGTNYVLKTTISKNENGNTSLFDHPIKEEQPINLYLDKKERLYIPTGGSFSENGVYMSASIMSPAYLYISKEPV